MEVIQKRMISKPDDFWRLNQLQKRTKTIVKNSKDKGCLDHLMMVKVNAADFLVHPFRYQFEQTLFVAQ